MLVTHHDGKFRCGRGIRADFFRQRKTLDEPLKNIIEAASLHFEGQRKPGEGLSLLLMSQTEIRRGKAAVHSRPATTQPPRATRVRHREKAQRLGV